MDEKIWKASSKQNRRTHSQEKAPTGLKIPLFNVDAKPLFVQSKMICTQRCFNVSCMLCENMLYFLFNHLKYVNYFDFLDIQIFITFIIN